MSERLTHSEICDLLARLMEDRVILETRRLAGPIEPDRQWKYTIAHVGRLAAERKINRLDMLAHLVYLGLAVDIVASKTVSSLIDNLPNQKSRWPC